MQSLIPLPLARRLVLGLLGYRVVDGRWCGPGRSLSDEDVDRMSGQAWRRWVARRQAAARATEDRR
jgi:hypothetical protein